MGAVVGLIIIILIVSVSFLSFLLLHSCAPKLGARSERNNPCPKGRASQWPDMAGLWGQYLYFRLKERTPLIWECSAWWEEQAWGWLHCLHRISCCDWMLESFSGKSSEVGVWRQLRACPGSATNALVKSDSPPLCSVCVWWWGEAEPLATSPQHQSKNSLSSSVCQLSQESSFLHFLTENLNMQ